MKTIKKIKHYKLCDKLGFVKVYIPFCLLTLSQFIQAQTIRYVPSQYATVTSAVSAANRGDTVDLVGSYIEPQLNVSKNLVIRGHGPKLSIISCIDTFSSTIFISNNVTVTILNLTVRDGYYGINIDSARVNINNCDIVYNKCGIFSKYSNKTQTLNILFSNISYNKNYTPSTGMIGGGISIDYTNEGTTTINNSKINYNKLISTQGVWGAGIFYEGQMDLTINNSDIEGNLASGGYYSEGAGIYIGANGNVIINKCNIFNNKVITKYFGDGGGIYAQRGIRSTIITNSSIFENSISSDHQSRGAGIYNWGQMSLSNSTICNNSILKTATGSGAGAGIYYDYVAGEICNCTISNNNDYNISNNSGVGVCYNCAPNYHLLIKNTIIANNYSNTTLADYYYGGCLGTAITSYGYNLISQPDSSIFNATGDIVGQNPKLDVLNNNGGFTPTEQLLAGSPAINAGSNTDIKGNPVIYDQRSYIRCNMPDIGAFESDACYNAITQITDNICGKREKLPIIKLEISVSDTISVSKFNFSTFGTDSPTEITKAQLFYTGSSNIFNSTNQFGDTVLSPNGIFYINGWQTLNKGKNYFWLTYDISPLALNGNSFDAGCNWFILGGNQSVPDTSFTYGNRMITKIKADFIINDSSQCFSGNNFIFKNNSSKHKSRVWSTGDGNNYTFDSLTHSYLQADTFSVKLVIINDIGCIDSTTKKIIVNPLPNPNYNINNNIQCLNTNLFKFSPIKSGQFIQKYFWNLGDGSNSTLDSVAHKYLTVDTFQVSLNVTSKDGCKDSSRKNVYTLSLPKAGFDIWDSSQCLERNDFGFINTSKYTGPLTYSWQFGDGNISVLQNPHHQYTIPDSFTVKLIAITIDGCSDSATRHTLVHVHPEPKADFMVNDTVQCFNGNSFGFTNSSTLKSGTFKQYWDFSDGTTSDSLNTSHSYSTFDTFTTKLLVISDWACKDSILKKVYVNSMPKTDFSINTNPQLLSGNNFIFTNLTNIPFGNLTYQWDFGDGSTSALVNGNHSYTTADTFNVKLTALSDAGCPDSITRQVYVDITITVDFTAKNFCFGDTVIFKSSGNAYPDSFRNYIWDYGDGKNAIVWKDPIHLYADTGTYTVTMVGLTYLGYKDTVSKTIMILPKPSLSITYYQDTTFYPGGSSILTANGTFDIDSILWSTGEKTTSIVVRQAGIYSVRVVGNNGCDAKDKIRIYELEMKPFVVMTVITPNDDGINDVWKVTNIEQYQPCKVGIYNRWGDELYSTNNYQNNWGGTYKGKKLPEGTYYYYLETRDGVVYKGAINIVR